MEGHVAKKRAKWAKQAAEFKRGLGGLDDVADEPNGVVGVREHHDVAAERGRIGEEAVAKHRAAASL